MGMGLAFTARVLPTGLVEAGIAFQGFDGEQEALVRERSDTDDDGTVSPAEAETAFRDALACLEEGEWVHFPVVDGMVSEISASVGTEGLIGPTDSSDRLRIEFTLSIEGGGSLHDGWRIVFPIWGHAISPEGIPVDMRSTTLEISIPQDYYIKPATLEPAQLGNHLTRDGRSIIVEGTGPEVHAMAVGGFDLQVGLDGPGDDDGTGGVGVDGPWLLYSLASIAILLFIVALIAWWRHSGMEDR
jgi:hypothetical protein